MRKGQTSVELMVILAVGLAVFLAIFAVSSDLNTSLLQQYKIAKSRAVVNDLAAAATVVHQQGVGAKTTLYLSFPADTKNVTFSGKTITLELTSGRKVYRNVDFAVSGKITASEGERWIAAEAQNSSVAVSDSG